MLKQIPEFNYSVDLLKSLIWQYDESSNLRNIIEQKNEWYQKNVTQFWQDWYKDIFDIRTANDFGLSVWAIILNVSFVVPNCSISLTTEQKRLICRLRYYQLVTRCSIPDINRILKSLFEGKTYVLDSYDMSELVYVFKYRPNNALALILLKYDLLPRPAGVGSDYRVITYKPFGFGRSNQNFNRAPFWNGGKVDNYYGYITFEHDEIPHITYGQLFVNDKTISVANVDVLITYTDNSNNTINHYVVTDENGRFSDDHQLEGIYSITGKAQIITPICTTLNIISRPLPLLINFGNKNGLITEDAQFILITEDNSYLTA